MKLKYNFVVNNVAGQNVAVAVGSDMEQFTGFIKMNDDSLLIFEMLRNDITLDEIIKNLVNEYGATNDEKLKTDVEQFINRLQQEDIIIS